jgi:tripartite-type tricarboxylate transporter receptor subunit TctC
MNLILPNASGGTLETNCRNWQPYVKTFWASTLSLILSKGGGGVIAANKFLGAADDCSYLFIDTFNQNAISQLMYDAEYTPDDFAYLGAFSYDPGIFFVRKDAGFADFNAFLDYVKEQPAGTVTVGLASLTDMCYIILKQLEAEYDIQFNIVNYSGGSKARQALVNGEVMACGSTWFACSSIVDDIQVLALTANTDRVYQGLEGIPTMAPSPALTWGTLSALSISPSPQRPLPPTLSVMRSSASSSPKPGTALTITATWPRWATKN